MLILSWVVIGAIAGWLASLIMKTNGSMGFLANMLVGIIGAFIGGFIVNFIGGQGVNGFNLWSIFVALIGSIVLLGIAKLISKNMA